MKRIATAAIALCLMSGTSAFAQDNQHNDKNSGPHGAAGGPPHGPSGGGPKGPPSGLTPQVHTVQTGPQGGQGRPSGFTPESRTVHPNGQTQGSTNQWNGGGQGSTNHWNGGQQGSNNRWNGGQQGSNNHWNGGQQGSNNHWNGGTVTGRPVGVPNGYRPGFGVPGYRPGGAQPRYNPQYYPRTYNLGVRYQWRGGTWRGPSGYYYRRWFYGQTLPFGWFAPQWWINDYYYYDLPVPPYGYAWVRNGPDALLVDINSGVVVSVVPDAFY